VCIYYVISLQRGGELFGRWMNGGKARMGCLGCLGRASMIVYVFLMELDRRARGQWAAGA
jgi:hypothetical protein